VALFLRSGGKVAGFAVGGPNGMKQADVSALMGRLNKSAPPANPGTPANRQDPSDHRMSRYAQLKRVSTLIDQDLTPDEIPLKAMISKVRMIADQLLLGLDPQAIMQQIITSLAPGTTPPGPPGGVTPPAPPPGAPMGPSAGPTPPGAPPLGAPPGMPSPVSPV